MSDKSKILKDRLKKFEPIHQGKCKHESIHFTHALRPIHSNDSPTILSAPYDMLSNEHKVKIDNMEARGLYAPCNH